MALKNSRQIAALIAPLLLFVLWLAIVLHYVPARYSYDWDSSQLGRGLTEYSIQKHQPHPPGYPFWVAAARVVAELTPSIPAALSILALLFSLFALIFFGLTIRELPTGRESAWWIALLGFSPPVLFYSAAQSSYSSDLFAASVAGYLAVRIEKGATLFVPFCLFLALAMGLRQSGAAFLTPLVALSAYTTWRRSKREVGLGLALGASSFAVWFVPFVRLAGGWTQYRELTSKQFEGSASHTSVLFGAPFGVHLSMLIDLAVWVAAGLAGFACAAAILRMISRDDGPEPLLPRFRLLVLLWGVPNLLFISLFHFPKPGYLMLSLPALVVGIGFAARVHGQSWKLQAAATAGIAVSLAVAFFPYQEWMPRHDAGLPFQVSRYMPPALDRIDADNRLLANALAQAGPDTPVVCLHWSGESPNCRSAPWDFHGYQWVDHSESLDSLAPGTAVLFLCDRPGPPDGWRSRMRAWTRLTEGWQISLWRATK